MLRKIVNSVTNALSAPPASGKAKDPAAREHAIQLATAVLMAEVARADFDYDESEFSLLLGLIRKHFDLSADDAMELANEASQKAEDIVSLHEFTQLLHQNLSVREKTKVISLLWKIAFADGRLDKYEDSLVSKISELLYVSRGTVMRTKHNARPKKA